MTTTERKELDQFSEGLTHVKEVFAAMQQVGPEEEVIVCPTCRSFRTVRKGASCECLTCSKVRGTGVR